MVLGYKYRLYPTEEQKKLLDHHFSIRNFIYGTLVNIFSNNTLLPDEKKKRFKKKDYYRLVKQKLEKYKVDYKSTILTETIIDFQEAIHSFFQNKTGFPKDKYKNSFRWTNVGFQILDHNNDKFKYFKLMKTKIKMRYHREFPENSKVKAINVSKHNDKYYVSFTIKFDKRKDYEKALNEVGIDMNINDIALSTGKLIQTMSEEILKGKINDKIQRLKRKQNRRRLEAKKNKKKLGSNYYKTKKEIAKLYEKLKSRQNDRYHKITNKITEENKTIIVEDLDVNELIHKNDKKFLQKHIKKTAFTKFYTYLEYKALEKNRRFEKVAPQYTSMTCSRCGTVNKKLTLSDRMYKCPICKNTLHRDLNASINILNKGIKKDKK